MNFLDLYPSKQILLISHLNLQSLSKIHLLLSKPPSFVFVLYRLNCIESLLEINKTNKATLN